MSGPLDVAIHLTATNGVSSVLSVISRDVLGLNANVLKLTHNISALKVGLTGAAGVLVGTAMFKGLEKLEQAGEKLVHVKTAFAAALPEQQRMASMAEITAAAWKEAGTNLQTTVSGNVEALHDLYNVTQSVQHAKELLPSFNVLKNSYASVSDHGATSSGSDVANAVRAFEMSGRNTAEALSKISREFASTNIALRGRVTGGSLLTQISNAGDSRYGFSDQFVSQTIPALIATGLGNRTGSALNAFSNNLYGGVASSEMQAKFQEQWGLHTKADELRDSHGKFKGFKVGSLWHADDARKDPLKWANDYRDYLKNDKHVDVNNLKAMQDIVAEIGRGNKLLKASLDELLLPMANRALNKEVGNIQSVSADAAGILSENDPKAIRAQLLAQWNNAWEGIGEHLVKPMMDNIYKPLTGVLRDVSQWAAGHPTEVAAMGKALLALSVGLTALGTVLVGGALIAAIGAGGWLVAGIATLAAAVKLFKPEAFNAAVSYISKMGGQMIDGFKQAFDGLKKLDFVAVVQGIAKVFDAQMLGLPGLVAAGIATAVAGIGAAIAGKIKDMLGSIPGLSKLPAPAGGKNPNASDLPGLSHQEGYAAPLMPRSKTASLTSHHNIHIDGHKVATAVTRHQVAMAEHPGSIGAADSYGHHYGPGTDLPAWG